MELSSLAGSIGADPAGLGGCAMVGGWPVDMHQALYCLVGPLWPPSRWERLSSLVVMLLGPLVLVFQNAPRPQEPDASEVKITSGLEQRH